MKTIPIMERSILCPKCHNQTLRKALGNKAIWPDMTNREYFCDQCHLYFSICELVNQWDYDIADFESSITDDGWQEYTNLVLKIDECRDSSWAFHNMLVSTLNTTPIDPIQYSIDCWDSDTVSILDEPVWTNIYERISDYETVTRMFLGIPEWEDFSIDTGALHI